MALSDFDIAYLTRVQSDANTTGGALASGAPGATVAHDALSPALAGAGDYCRAYKFSAPSVLEDSVNQVKLLVASADPSASSDAPRRLVNPPHDRAVSMRLWVRLDRGADADATDNADNALTMVGLSAFTSDASYSGGYELVLRAKGSGASRTVKLALRAQAPVDYTDGHASLLSALEVFCAGDYTLGQWYLIRLDVLPIGAKKKQLLALLSEDGGTTWGTVGSMTVDALQGSLWREGTEADPNRNGIIVLRSGEADATELYTHYFAQFDARVESVDVNTPPSINSLPDVATVPDVITSVPLSTAVGGKDEDEFLFYSATLTGGAPLPGWIGIDRKTGRFVGTPPAGSEGSLSIDVSVEDERGATSTKTVNFTVQPAASTPTPTTLTTSGVVQEATANTVIGELGSSDPLGSTVTHSIVGGAGDSSYVSIQNNQVVLSQDVPAGKDALSFWVRTENESGFYTQKQITLPLAPPASNDTDLFNGSTTYQGLVSDIVSDPLLGGSSDIIVATLSPPVVALDNDTSQGSNVTSDPAYSVTGVKAGASVEYSLDDSTWTATKPSLQEGANVVYVRQRDALSASESTTLTCTLDTVAPTVTSGNTGSLVQANLAETDGDVAYTVTTSDPNEEIFVELLDGAEAFFSVDGDKIRAHSLTGQDTYAFSIAVKDRARNQTTVALTISVDNSTPVEGGTADPGGDIGGLPDEGGDGTVPVDGSGDTLTDPDSGDAPSVGDQTSPFDGQLP